MKYRWFYAIERQQHHSTKSVWPYSASIRFTIFAAVLCSSIGVSYAGVSYALTQYLIILAYRYATATELSPFNYSVVVFSGILGWWLFGNVPNAFALIGTVLICMGGILSIEAGHAEGHGHAFGCGHWQLHWKRQRATITAA